MPRATPDSRAGWTAAGAGFSDSSSGEAVLAGAAVLSAVISDFISGVISGVILGGVYVWIRLRLSW